MRTTSLLIAILLCLATSINAQFRVYQNGNIVFSLDDQLPDSVSLQNDTPTPLKLSKTTIGNTDNTSDWWGDFSDLLAIPSGKRLIMEFDNYSGKYTYNNWILIAANKKVNPATTTDGYKEYFALRSDSYGWGGAMGTEEGYDYLAANITSNYAEVAAAAGATDQWAYFREKINGSHVVMTVDHTTSGHIIVNATMTATDGTLLKQNYTQKVNPSEDVYVYLTVDNCHYENLTASLTRSTATVEHYPTQLELSYTPTILRLGDTNFHNGLTGKVYFKDGASITISENELSYIQPDISTTGTKTITALYNKDSLGNTSHTVFASYNITIYDISSISLQVNENVKYLFSADAAYLPFIKPSATVKAICSDNSQIIIDNSQVTFSNVTTDGSVTATYSNLSASATVNIATKKATQYGASDFSTTYESVISPDEQLKKGATLSKTIQLRSDNTNSYPVILIRNANKDIYAKIFTNGGYMLNGVTTPTIDRSEELYDSSIDGSIYTINIINNGATIDAKIDIIDGSGNPHHLYITGIDTSSTSQVDDDDVYISFTTEYAYLLISDL